LCFPSVEALQRGEGERKKKKGEGGQGERRGSGEGWWVFSRDQSDGEGARMAKGLKDPVTREYTINLAKRLHGTTFKKRAPRAVKEVKAFAAKTMGTKDVRLDVKLNKFLWHRGIRSVPRRIRVQISRKRNDDDDAEEDMYSHVTVVELDAKDVKGLDTKVIEDDD